jgi:hypothetical protein
VKYVLVSLCRRLDIVREREGREGREDHFPFRHLLRFCFDILGVKSQGGWCKREKVEKVIFSFSLLLRSRFDTLGGQ